MERWDLFEISLKGKTEGNPFTDYLIYGTFVGEKEEKTVEGFYDGDGVYVVRFMPSYEGEYRYRIFGSFSDREYEGNFLAEKPSENNHGIVRAKDTWHFSYDDGTPFFPLGTTCYVWHLQSEQLKAQTLQSLKNFAFNKIRFCVFPKHFDYNLCDPPLYPFEGTPMDSSVLTSENFQQYNGNPEGNSWDFTKFDPRYFRNIEDCILKLQKIGIQADIIIFHPYDRWGFSQMSHEADMRYLRYVTARFSAYRNVWWALANEYDLMSAKALSDWNSFGNFIAENDPYGHLRSIHNCGPFYDHSKNWITHCSIQRQDLYKTSELTNEWRERYHKPIVLDEIAYEGNIQHGWGNISGEETVRRFWEAVCRGGYPCHGETFYSSDSILWWSHGGTLKGDSPERIAFLKNILSELPTSDLKQGNFPWEWDCVCAVPEDEKIYAETGLRIYYFSFMRPCFRDFYFDDNTEYRVEVIDTWEMKIHNVGIYKGKFRIGLPSKAYMAIRVMKSSD